MEFCKKITNKGNICGRRCIPAYDCCNNCFCSKRLKKQRRGIINMVWWCCKLKKGYIFLYESKKRYYFTHTNNYRVNSISKTFTFDFNDTKESVIKDVKSKLTFCDLEFINYRRSKQQKTLFLHIVQRIEHHYKNFLYIQLWKIRKEVERDIKDIERDYTTISFMIKNVEINPTLFNVCKTIEFMFNLYEKMIAFKESFYKYKCEICFNKVKQVFTSSCCDNKFFICINCIITVKNINGSYKCANCRSVH